MKQSGERASRASAARPFDRMNIRKGDFKATWQRERTSRASAGRLVDQPGRESEHHGHQQGDCPIGIVASHAHQKGDCQELGGAGEHREAQQAECSIS